MAVYKTNNGRWEARISYRDDFGKVKSKRKRFDLKREALDFETAFLKSLNTLTDDSMVYEDLFEAFLKINRQSANERTIKSKVFLADKFWSHLMKKKVSKITKKDYLNVWFDISNSNYSAGRKNKAIHFLKAVSKFGYQYYDYNDNAKTLESIKETPKEITDDNVWTLDQLNTFLEHVDNEMMKTLFWFLFFTGMRIGEARAITKDKINGKDITVNKTVRSYKEGLKTPKTLSSNRVVTLDDVTFEKIQPLIEYEGDFLFGGLEPIGMSTVQRAWEQAFESAPVPRIRIHDLRHSHATLLINNDVNIVAVSRRLGHSDIQTTLKVYTHLLEKTNEQMMTTLNKISK